MKLDEIIGHVQKDFKQIDRLDIINEYSSLSNLFQKYIVMKSDENTRLGMMINNRRTLVQDKHDYYSGNASADVYAKNPFNLKIKTEAGIQKYIDADADIIALDNRILVQKEKVEIITAALYEIKNRQWTIKGLQEQIKFEAGG